MPASASCFDQPGIPAWSRATSAGSSWSDTVAGSSPITHHPPSSTPSLQHSSTARPTSSTFSRHTTKLTRTHGRRPPARRRRSSTSVRKASTGSHRSFPATFAHTSREAALSDRFSRSRPHSTMVAARSARGIEPVVNIEQLKPARLIARMISGSLGWTTGSPLPDSSTQPVPRRASERHRRSMVSRSIARRPPA